MSTLKLEKNSVNTNNLTFYSYYMVKVTRCNIFSKYFIYAKFYYLYNYKQDTELCNLYTSYKIIENQLFMIFILFEML